MRASGWITIASARVAAIPCERALELGDIACRVMTDLEPELRCRLACRLELLVVARVVRVGDHADALHSGQHLAKQLDTLAGKLISEKGHAGETAARAAQAFHDAQLDRVAAETEHYGSISVGLAGRMQRPALGNEHRGLERRRLNGQLVERFARVVAVACVDDEVAARHIAVRRHALHERVEKQRAALLRDDREPGNAMHLRLLCACERCCEQSTRGEQELPASGPVHVCYFCLVGVNVAPGERMTPPASCLPRRRFMGQRQQRKGDYPAKPLRLITPFNPGGAIDIYARLIAEPLSRRLGQNIVVDSIAGANTIVGTQALIRAAPDGHTFMITTMSTTVNNRFRESKIPYDPGPRPGSDHPALQWRRAARRDRRRRRSATPRASSSGRKRKTAR
jgi:hypothetical protein